MRDAFFHLNFLNATDILAQKVYDARATFRQFSDVKDGTIPAAKCLRSVGMW